MTLAHHNSETGDVQIYSAHSRDVMLWSGGGFIGREGIRSFHQLHMAFREAERLAYQRAMSDAANKLRTLIARINP